jgi:hypothetical protein
MRASVAAAWPAFIKPYEGVTDWMYLDTKLKLTTGVGFLIDSVRAAQALTWWRKDGTQATDDEVATEWRRVKALTSLAPKGGYAYRASAVLHLTQDDINRVLMDKTAQFWARLLDTLPRLEDFPADAQLAVLDEAWQNGPAFLDLMKNGAYVWSGTRAALLSENFDLAASHVPGTGSRAGRRRRLFQNAAAVVRLGLDPERLWDAETPHTEDEVTPADLAAIGKLIDERLDAKLDEKFADLLAGDLAAITAGKLVEELGTLPTAADVAAAVWDANVPSPEASANPDKKMTAKGALRYAGVKARQALDAVKAITPAPPAP